MIIDSIILPLLAGVLTASWGAYKDSPYENFHISSYLRSVIQTVIYYNLINYLLPSTVSTKLITLLSAIAFERITQEIWKAFFRTKHQDEVYRIPQKFHAFGEVLSRKKRLVIGSLLTLLLMVSIFALSRLPVTNTNLIVYGLIFSLLPSIGGAWKDAPIEGFQLDKFPRSFLVTLTAILVLRPFTNNLMLLLMGAAGLERVLVEFYKTFITKSVPGKFVGKVVAQRWVTKRKIFIYFYFSSVTLVITLLLSQA